MSTEPVDQPNDLKLDTNNREQEEQVSFADKWLHIGQIRKFQLLYDPTTMKHTISVDSIHGQEEHVLDSVNDAIDQYCRLVRHVKWANAPHATAEEEAEAFAECSLKSNSLNEWTPWTDQDDDNNQPIDFAHAHPLV